MSRFGALFTLLPLLATVGCTYEPDGTKVFVPVTGKVTYHNSPVELGTISFLPFDPKGTPATGQIAGGVIQNVTSVTQSDGIKVGRYRVAISAYNKEYLEGQSERGPEGPDPAIVTKAANKAKIVIPVRYSNARDSGLVAVIKPEGTDLNYVLED
ncbi:hypothetical protein ACYOEI_28550 [Singulisphaera rosea]